MTPLLPILSLEETKCLQYPIILRLTLCIFLKSTTVCPLEGHFGPSTLLLQCSIYEF